LPYLVKYQVSAAKNLLSAKNFIFLKEKSKRFGNSVEHLEILDSLCKFDFLDIDGKYVSEIVEPI
jgi:hypothetical protein